MAQGGGRLRLAAAGQRAWLQLEGAQLGPCFLMSQPEQPNDALMSLYSHFLLNFMRKRSKGLGVACGPCCPLTSGQSPE